MPAGLRRRPLEPRPLPERPVADELLDRVDPHPVIQMITVAAVLAGRRAHAAHDGRKRVGVGSALEGIRLRARPGRG